MRYINKLSNTQNVQLDQEIVNKGVPDTEEQASSRWSKFKGKTELSRQLLAQQYGLCCYSELNLTDLAIESNIGTHIEHEKPKRLFPDRTFDYGNLLLCALASEDLNSFSKERRFGGHYKLGEYDEEKFVSPHDTNCRDYFIYSSGSGEISPNLALPLNQQEKAQETIKLLNLNAPFLKAERKQWLAEIEICLEPLLDASDLESIELLAEVELTLTERYDARLSDKCDQLRKFHSAVRAIFGQLGEKVIQKYCPNID